MTSGATGIHILERSASGRIERSAADARDGRWSPDGTRSAYSANVDGQVDIFVLDKDGKVTRVTDDPQVEQPPRWNADGNELIFAGRQQGRDLWMLDLPALPWAAQRAASPLAE